MIDALPQPPAAAVDPGSRRAPGGRLDGPTSERWFLLACLGFVAVWYPLLQSLLAHEPFGFGLFRPALLGMVFNSMAESLLAGRFDIDPDAIDFEAFRVGDRTVAYFGIFCAFLRLPLLLTGNLGQLDITRLSCLVAICVGVWAQLGAVLLVRGSVAQSSRRQWLSAALIICILFGGQQIQFLRASIYQEVIDWAGALAMIFVCLAMRGLVSGRDFDTATLTAMAGCAGAALLARVSFGLGLYVALGLLLMVRGRFVSMLVPGMVLLGFAAVAAGINYGRWGNPFTFADFTRYGMSLDLWPDRLIRLAEYGVFNPQRIWFGLSYYFLPLWAIVRPDGQFLWAETQARLFDSIELPPGSFLLSDPLLLGLCVVGVVSARRREEISLLIGMAVPPLLMLCAISLSHRYRMEFYPLLVFGALLGFKHLCRTAAHSRLTRTAIAAIAFATVTGVAVSHFEAALYAVSPWGPAEQYIPKNGWIGTYHELVDGLP
jgi:hypothetical protein